MTTADLLCGAVILPAIGVMASVLGRPKSAEKASDSNDSSLSGSQTAGDLDSEVEVLRSLHQVRLVDPEDEGSGAAQLRGGIFGFTYSPLQASPIFRKKTSQSFEVHKLPDGRIHVVGFVTEDEASRISASTEQLDVRLYPEACENAYTAVSIPASRVRRFSGPSRSDGNGLQLDLAPDIESLQ